MASHEARPLPEIPLEAVPPEEFEFIKSALYSPQFRTVNGIHHETGVPPEHVSAVLNHTDIARQSPLRTKQGNTIYALRERRKTLREHLEIVRWVLAR